MSSKTLIAVGTLFTLGAAGGFALSAQVSPAAIDSALQQGGGGGGGGEGGAPPSRKSQGAGPAQKRNDGGSSAPAKGGAGRADEASERPGAERDEGEEAAGAPAERAPSNPDQKKAAARNDRPSQGGADGGGPARPSPPPAEAAAAEAPGDPAGASAPCRSVDLAGVEAAAFLSGNTASGVGEDGAPPEITYFAPRGWIARIRSDAMVVRAWNPGAATLCEADQASGGASLCEVIQARKCLDPDRGRYHIGDYRTRAGRWMRVLKGNLQDFPPYLPYLDPPPAAAADARKRPGGAHALENAAFAGGTAYRRPSQGAPGRDRALFFDEAGRLFDFAVPTAEEIENGVRVETGRWAMRRGDVCRGATAAGAEPTCWSASAGKGGRPVLRSRSAPAGAELVAVRDPKPVASAADDIRLALLPRSGGAELGAARGLAGGR